MLHRFVFALAATSLAAAGTLGLGCGSSSSAAEGTPVPESGAMDGATGGDANMMPPPDSAVDAPDAADAGPVDRIGAIFAISDTVTGGAGVTSSYRAGASFRHITTPDGTTTSKTVGPCLVETIGDGTSEVSQDLSAGAVHIEGGSKTIDLTPMTDLTYAPQTGNTSLWTGGELLTARGDGKDVPMFTTSLKAPPKITLSAPAAPAGALTVTRSAGVTATFVAGASGSVVLISISLRARRPTRSPAPSTRRPAPRRCLRRPSPASRRAPARSISIRKRPASSGLPVGRCTSPRARRSSIPPGPRWSAMRRSNSPLPGARRSR